MHLLAASVGAEMAILACGGSAVTIYSLNLLVLTYRQRGKATDGIQSHHIRDQMQQEVVDTSKSAQFTIIVGR